MISLAIAIVINIMFLYLAGYPYLEIISILFTTGYSDINYLLIKSSPYVLEGLAFSIPFIAGVFNIGGEGQLYLGALSALIASYYTNSSVIAILAGMIGGFILAFLIALLRVYRNVNEVVSAIMLNWFMYYTVSFIITAYIYDPNAPYQSRPVPPPATIDPITTFLLSLAISILIYIFLKYNVIGYMIRVSGISVRSAVYAGIDPRRSIILSMSLGGALAGLGGALIPLGVKPHVIDNTMSALYGIGFLGIGIGLLGRNNPIGIVISAIFVAGLIIGGQNVERLTGVPPEIVDMIVGIIIISMSIPELVRVIRKRGVVER